MWLHQATRRLIKWTGRDVPCRPREVGCQTDVHGHECMGIRLRVGYSTMCTSVSMQMAGGTGVFIGGEI